MRLTSPNVAGRGGRGRGEGRGRGRGCGDRRGRDFDRRDGTGRGHEGAKRGGTGKGNWGTAEDEMSPADEPTPAAEPIADTGAEADAAEAEAEEQSNEMTLEAFMRQKEEQRAALNKAAPAKKVDEAAFAGMDVVVQKHEDPFNFSGTKVSTKCLSTAALG